MTSREQGSALVKCENLKIKIYLVNIGLVDEKVKPLKGNRERSFRIRHFQQPTTPSSGRSIDDVIFGSHQMLSSMETVIDRQNFKLHHYRLIGNHLSAFIICNFYIASASSSDDVTSRMRTNTDYQETDPRMHRWALTQRVR